MTLQTTDTTIAAEPGFAVRMARMLWADKFALCAAIFLIVVLILAIVGPSWLGDLATKQNLRGRNAAPFEWERGWVWWMGADALGRPVACPHHRGNPKHAHGGCRRRGDLRRRRHDPRLIAGFSSPRVNQVIMRLADVIMSFPSLLIAVIVLYVLGSSILNLMLVLSITRIPVYLRTTRAEVLEIRERMFVQAARVMGASSRRILFRHILPVVLPTLTTLATLDFAYVMLAESALSFLGIGIQPPEITWGLMISQGRQYLTNAWWLSFWPGLAIILTTMSLNLLSNWMRIALDPVQRWRLEMKGRKNG